MRASIRAHASSRKLVKMPTVLRAGGYRFYFYSHEPGEPPHIHVDKDGATAKFWLERPALVRSSGFNARDLAEIFRLVNENRPNLLESWHGFFGPER